MPPDFGIPCPPEVVLNLILQSMSKDSLRKLGVECVAATLCGEMYGPRVEDEEEGKRLVGEVVKDLETWCENYTRLAKSLA